jgi:hypothetical protein
MEHARVNFITIDPRFDEEVMRYISSEARPQVENEPGSTGMAMLVNTDLGVLVVESFWVSGDAMHESERSVPQFRKEILRLGVATVSVEQFEVATTIRHVRPTASAAARLMRAGLEPKHTAATIESFGDIGLAPLSVTEGFCTSAVLLHRATHRAIIEMIWKDGATLATSRGVSASARADFVAATDSKADPFGAEGLRHSAEAGRLESDICSQLLGRSR